MSSVTTLAYASSIHLADDGLLGHSDRASRLGVLHDPAILGFYSAILDSGAIQSFGAGSWGPVRRWRNPRVILAGA